MNTPQSSSSSTKEGEPCGGGCRMWAVWAVLATMWACSLTHGHTSTETNRFLSVFSVVRFKNSECPATGEDTGVCYPSAACYRGGGEEAGQCASGFGICCLTKVGCSASASNNMTYIESPSYPSTFNYATTCTHTLHFSEDICQLRLDVAKVELAPPNTQGNCVDDWLTFSQDIKWERVCGTSINTHFYLDVEPSVSTSISFTFTTNSSVSYARRWKIRVSQISCGQFSLAPSGCGQYFTTSSGTIKGWNHDGLYLSGQNYAICVRKELNSCSTTYVDNQNTMFIPACGDTFEWPYPVFISPDMSVTCFSNPTFINSAPFTVPLQGPNYIYLVTKDTTNSHIYSSNINYNYTQNSC